MSERPTNSKQPRRRPKWGRLRQRVQPNPRLRKQPKMRRVQSASYVAPSRISVPKQARRRRRRNQRLSRIPTDGIKRFVFSSRWISLILLAIMIGALVLIGLDENFYLSVIPVEGSVSIPAEEIVAASGLGGVHIFAADPNLAAERIAEEVPGVIAVAVTLSWPNDVLIQVEEESPVAIWSEQGQKFWVTEDGRLLPARSNINDLLTLESEIPIAPQPVFTPETEADDAEELADTGPQASIAFVPDGVLEGAMLLQQLRPNIDKLYYRPSSGLSYEDGRGWRVYFGTGLDMQQKLVVYETIVADLLARGLTPDYVSVSNQNKPYYQAQ